MDRSDEYRYRSLSAIKFEGTEKRRTVADDPQRAQFVEECIEKLRATRNPAYQLHPDERETWLK